MLIVERAGKSKLRGSAPRYVVLQRREMLLPFGLALPYLRERINSKPPAIIREFYNLDGASIAFRLVVIGKSRKANSFHAYEQAVRPERRRAKDQYAPRDFIHSVKSRTKLILPDSSAGEARVAAAWLLRVRHVLPAPQRAATEPP